VYFQVRCCYLKLWGGQVCIPLRVILNKYPCQLVAVNILLFFYHQQVVGVGILVAFDMPVLKAELLTLFRDLGDGQIDIPIVIGGFIRAYKAGRWK